MGILLFILFSLPFAKTNATTLFHYANAACLWLQISCRLCLDFLCPKIYSTCVTKTHVSFLFSLQMSSDTKTKNKQAEESIACPTAISAAHKPFTNDPRLQATGRVQIKLTTLVWFATRFCGRPPKRIVIQPAAKYFEYFPLRRFDTAESLSSSWHTRTRWRSSRLVHKMEDNKLLRGSTTTFRTRTMMIRLPRLETHQLERLLTTESVQKY